MKALAVTPDGSVVGRAEVEYPLSTPRPGWAEQQPDDWWKATQTALQQLGARHVAGIGLSGQMHGLVVLDEKLSVLRPAILWNDQRTSAECAEIEERVGLERLIRLTGNRALTGFTAPKLLWLRNNEVDVYRRIAHLLLPKDYVRLRLTGERAIDVADASGTLLFDVAHRCWSTEMLELLELSHDPLPRVHESPQISGETPAGIAVAAGAGDQAAGALGVGVDRPGPLSVQLGTSGVVFAAMPSFQADPEARVHSFCHAVPGAWHAMGVMLSAAGSLRWLRDAVAPGADFAALTAEAERWEPGVEGLTFLPYLAGERTPHADPDARGAFVGLSLRHDRGALVRAVLEGVAFGLRDSLELLKGLGVAPESARALRWRRPERPLASHRCVRPRNSARTRRGGRRGRVWRCAPRRGRGRRLQGRARGGRAVRARTRCRRARPRLAGGLRRRVRAVPRALSGARAVRIACGLKPGARVSPLRW